jgi:hypothetical protein
MTKPSLPWRGLIIARERQPGPRRRLETGPVRRGRSVASEQLGTFAVDPAAECSVAFTVTAAASPPLASTGPGVPVAPLVVLGVIAIAIGTWLTVRPHPRS